MIIFASTSALGSYKLNLPACSWKNKTGESRTDHDNQYYCDINKTYRLSGLSSHWLTASCSLDGLSDNCSCACNSFTSDHSKWIVFYTNIGHTGGYAGSVTNWNIHEQDLQIKRINCVAHDAVALELFGYKKP